jgi:hypothetical protein
LKRVFKELAPSNILSLTTFLDRLLLIVLIAVSVSGLFFVEKLFPSGSLVRVYMDNKPVYSLPLDEDRIVRVEGPLGDSYVEIRNGEVRMKDSPCPDKICIEQGWTNRGVITCLPNKVVVSVVSDDMLQQDNEYDAITK